MPKLQLSLPDGSQLDHELTDDVVTIGRASDNTLEIDDPSVSSHHAQIAPGGNNYVLRDLGSTNGTRLNHRPCTADSEYPISPGDRILFGSVEGVFDPEAAAARSQVLPDSEGPAASVGKSSVKPSNFMNESPFRKKTAAKDPVSTAIIVLAGVATLLLVVAAVMVLGMKAA